MVHVVDDSPVSVNVSAGCVKSIKLHHQPCGAVGSVKTGEQAVAFATKLPVAFPPVNELGAVPPDPQPDAIVKVVPPLTVPAAVSNPLALIVVPFIAAAVVAPTVAPSIVPPVIATAFAPCVAMLPSGVPLNCSTVGFGYVPPRSPPALPPAIDTLSGPTPGEDGDPASADPVMKMERRREKAKMILVRMVIPYLGVAGNAMIFNVRAEP